MTKNNEIYERTECLIGKGGQEKLLASKVVIFGLGGVGGYALEALARAGVGKLVLVDHDKIQKSNINRQILALHSSLDQFKTDIAKKRVNDINPDIEVICHQVFAKKENLSEIIGDDVSYIIDAIDSVQSKVDIIKYAKTNNIPIISSMGTGCKVDNLKFQIADIKKTHTCPLAKRIRKILKVEGIENLEVLYSNEKNKVSVTDCIPSISYVPSVAGLVLAGHVINKMLEEKDQ